MSHRCVLKISRRSFIRGFYQKPGGKGLYRNSVCLCSDWWTMSRQYRLIAHCLEPRTSQEPGASWFGVWCLFRVDGSACPFTWCRSKLATSRLFGKDTQLVPRHWFICYLLIPFHWEFSFISFSIFILKETKHFLECTASEKMKQSLLDFTKAFKCYHALWGELFCPKCICL